MNSPLSVRLATLVTSLFLTMIFPGFSQIVKIVEPNGSEKWTVGEIHLIRWTGVSASTPVRLQYTTNNGVSWISISDAAVGNSYIWKVPATPSSSCLIKIVATPDSSITLRSHTSFINTGSFSRDGQMAVTASDDKTAVVWDAKTGTMLKKYSGHSSDAMFADFNNDDTRLAVSSLDRTILIYDVASGIILNTLSGHTNSVNYLSYSPDGSKIATASEDGTAILWDAMSGSILKTFRGHSAGVYSAFFNSTGTQIATASRDQSVVIWDVSSASAVRTFNHPDIVHWASFGPGDSLVAVGCRNNLAYVWNINTQNIVLTLAGHAWWVWSAEFSKDGKAILTGSRDGTAKMWNATDGRLMRTFSGHTGDIGAARFSPDQTRILTTSNDQTARIWFLEPAGVTDVSDALFTIRNIPTPCDSTETTIDFRNGFSDLAKAEWLTTNGNCALRENTLQLVTANSNSRGSAWFRARQPVACKFSTQFRFRSSNGSNGLADDGSYPGGDGLAFVIQNNNGTTQIGESSSGLGYAGIPNSLAIEFDTYNNGDKSDASGNHVAVQSAGAGPNSSHHRSPYLLGINRAITPLRDSVNYHARIDFDPGVKTLNVYLDTTGRFDQPVLSIPNLDLASLLKLERQTHAFVGFTAATGDAVARYDISMWTFCGCHNDLQSDVSELPPPTPSITSYPNPASDLVYIEFPSVADKDVSIMIYDSMGALVDRLYHKSQQGTYTTAAWNSNGVASGLYHVHTMSGAEVYKTSVLVLR